MSMSHGYETGRLNLPFVGISTFGKSPYQPDWNAIDADVAILACTAIMWAPIQVPDAHPYAAETVIQRARRRGPDRAGRYIGRPCDNSASTCLSLATISSSLCLFCGIPGILQRLESLLQGGPLFRGQTIRAHRQMANTFGRGRSTHLTETSPHYCDLAASRAVATSCSSAFG